MISNATTKLVGIQSTPARRTTQTSDENEPRNQEVVKKSPKQLSANLKDSFAKQTVVLGGIPFVIGYENEKQAENGQSRRHI